MRWLVIAAIVGNGTLAAGCGNAPAAGTLAALPDGRPLVRDDADANQVLEAVNAKLATYRSVNYEIVVELGSSTTTSIVEATRDNGKLLVRAETRTSSPAKLLEIIDGDAHYTHWIGEPSAKKRRFDPRITHTPLTVTPYLDKALAPRRIPDETMDGRKAFVLEVSFGKTRGTLYFDAVTGIMLKMITEVGGSAPAVASTRKIIIDSQVPRERFALPPGITIEN